MIKILSLAALATIAMCMGSPAQSLVGEWRNPTPGWYLGSYSMSRDGQYFAAKVNGGPFNGRSYLRLMRVAQGKFSGETYSMTEPPKRFPATATLLDGGILFVRPQCDRCEAEQWHRLPPAKPRQLGPVIKNPGPIRIPPRHNLDQRRLQQNIR